MTLGRLVVNADDLGVTPGATRGIVEAHRRGCVTSASLVVTTPHYRHAVDACVRMCPELGIGLHFTLTLGKPASRPERVPLLIDSTGHFRWRFVSLLFAMTNGRPGLAEQIGIELEAQLARLRTDGIRPDHIDGERHVHLIPGIFELVTAAAARHNISFVRAGVDASAGSPLRHLPRLLVSGGFVKSWLLTQLAVSARASLPPGVRTADRVASYRYSGRMDLVLDAVLSAPADSGITEVMVHPGIPDESRGVDVGDRALSRYLASEDRRLELNACIAASTEQRQRVTTFAKLAVAAADARVAIVRMGVEHVDAVARLHHSSLGGLLSRLGEPAVRAYYRGALRTGQLDAFVCLTDGAVAGFVAGSAQPSELRRGVLRANPLGVASWLLGALAHPSSWRWLAESLRGPEGRAFDAHVPELTYLATTGHQRGQGIGRRLVDAFSAAMRARGVPAYELSVDEANGAAAGYYEHLGFRQVGQYQEFDATYRRYRLSIGEAR